MSDCASSLSTSIATIMLQRPVGIATLYPRESQRSISSGVGDVSRYLVQLTTGSFPPARAGNTLKPMSHNVLNLLISISLML